MKTRILVLIVASLFLYISGCAPSIRFSSGIGVVSGTYTKKNNENYSYLAGQSYRGVASYYADKFHGRQTSSGEVFDMNGLTAAHRTLPFGTMVEVKNLANNRKVVVKVNDRGPFVEDRIIDLSKGAAEQLDMIRTGTAEVELKVISVP